MEIISHEDLGLVEGGHVSIWRLSDGSSITIKTNVSAVERLRLERGQLKEHGVSAEEFERFCSEHMEAR